MKTYFSDRLVNITTGKMTVSGTTYPLEKILSYQVTEVREEKFAWKKFAKRMSMIGSGLVGCLFAGLLWLEIYDGQTFLYASGACIVAAAVAAYLTKPRRYPVKDYQLSLETASGRKSAIWSTNRAYVQSVANALGNALDRR